ncbi:hypothetical protein [Nocardia sp. NPDC049149]|uniref:hypothetical protein n=1 Tax=Nocardia sp. NPDC049149 TaxID=3364315 RepID=UPI0037224BAD
MFERCHSPHEVAYVYARHGYPVELACGRASILTSSKLGAVVMVSSLGRSVRELLGDAVPVPIISHPKHRQWIFLAGPERARRLGPQALIELQRHDVRVLNAGCRLWLPMSDSRTGWYWASPPLGGMSSVPSRTSVFQAVRAALDSRTVAHAERC